MAKPNDTGRTAIASELQELRDRDSEWAELANALALDLIASSMDPLDDDAPKSARDIAARLKEYRRVDGKLVRRG